jgi:hypothetical protein
MDKYTSAMRDVPCQLKEVVCEKSVHNAIGSLERSLGEHHGLLKELENQLHVVLGPDSPDEIQPERKPANCSMADTIYSNTSGLNECSCIVRSILKRLQV